MVQLSQPYETTGKTIVLTTQTFVGKVMSLLFNMLSRLVISCNTLACANGTPRGAVPVLRLTIKAQKSVVPQFQELSAPSPI